MVEELKNNDGLSRRTVVKGAAWTVPAVAAAVAVPTSSASVAPCPPSQTVMATNADQGVLTVAVPPQVTMIKYTVGGGRGGRDGNYDYAQGAVVSGEIPVSALGGATTLQLIAGQKGFFGASGAGVGGKGFGNGGNGGNSTNDSLSGGGGGGSAILTGDGAPLVVAGGGGGGSSTANSSANAAYDRVFVDDAPLGGGPQSAWGGDLGAPAFRGRGAVLRSKPDGQDVTQVAGGEGAQLGSPGAPGAVTGTTTAFVTGQPGNGRDGGDGVTMTAENPLLTVGSGGGGGGYFGGGAGSGARLKDATGEYVVSSNGGGGSSWAAPGVTGTSSRTGSTGHGFVTIEFVC